MAKDKTANNIEDRIGGIRESQRALDKEFLAIEAWLNELGRDMDAVNARLHEMKAQKSVVREEPKPAVSEGDFRAQLEKLLQGSLGHLEDRLSRRILNMLKDLKVATGPVRDAKLRELKDAVDSEVVDLSGLFIHEKIESNIDEIGIEEKESKGIQKGLERLRKMRGGDGKKGKRDGDKESEGR